MTVEPPSGQTCQQYLGQYISNFGGYVTNPDAASSCQFCSYRTTDQFLQTNSNIFYSHHWRNFGLMWVYVGFNVRRIVSIFRSGVANSYFFFAVCVDIYFVCYDVYLPHSWTCESFLSETFVRFMKFVVTIPSHLLECHEICHGPLTT